MPLWKVLSDPDAVVPRFDHVDAVVVSALTGQDAIALAQARIEGDADSLWAAAAVNEFDVDMGGWGLRLVLLRSDSVHIIDTTYIGVAGDDFDAFMTNFANHMNTSTDGEGEGVNLNNVSYTPSTKVLQISDSEDAIGDYTFTLTLIPPAGTFNDGYTWDSDTNLIDSKTEGGLSSAHLDVTFKDDFVVPQRLVAYKQ